MGGLSVKEIAGLLGSSSILSLVAAVGVGVIILMLWKGKIRRVGKDGIVLSEDKTSYDLLSAQLQELKASLEGFIKTTNASLGDLRESSGISKIDRLEIHHAINDIRDSLRGVSDDSRRQNKELLKTQILLSGTSMEQKLYLYDEYKKLGGNGWMDVYIQKLKDKMALEGLPNLPIGGAQSGD